VLGWYEATSKEQAISQSRALLRFSGAGHTAAIHSSNPQTIMDYASNVEAYRIVVNAPCSQGASGMNTNLAPTMTVGTGYFGRSSIGENVGPMHLVHWTSLAYNENIGLKLEDFSQTKLNFSGPLPEAPSDGVPRQSGSASHAKPDNIHPVSREQSDALRDDIRRIIAEELRSFLKD